MAMRSAFIQLGVIITVLSSVQISQVKTFECKENSGEKRTILPDSLNYEIIKNPFVILMSETSRMVEQRRSLTQNQAENFFDSPPPSFHFAFANERYLDKNTIETSKRILTTKKGSGNGCDASVPTEEAINKVFEKFCKIFHKKIGTLDKIMDTPWAHFESWRTYVAFKVAIETDKMKDVYRRFEYLIGNVDVLKKDFWDEINKLLKNIPQEPQGHWEKVKAAATPKISFKQWVISQSDAHTEWLDGLVRQQETDMKRFFFYFVAPGSNPCYEGSNNSNEVSCATFLQLINSLPQLTYGYTELKKPANKKEESLALAAHAKYKTCLHGYQYDSYEWVEGVEKQIRHDDRMKALKSAGKAKELFEDLLSTLFGWINMSNLAKLRIHCLVCINQVILEFDTLALQQP